MGSYQRERDNWREKREPSPKWELDATMSHAAEVFSLIDAKHERASSIARVIYVKSFHGGNSSKDDKLTQPERLMTETSLLMPDTFTGRKDLSGVG